MFRREKKSTQRTQIVDHVTKYELDTAAKLIAKGYINFFKSYEDKQRNVHANCVLEPECNKNYTCTSDNMASWNQLITDAKNETNYNFLKYDNGIIRPLVAWWHDKEKNIFWYGIRGTMMYETEGLRVTDIPAVIKSIPKEPEIRTDISMIIRGMTETPLVKECSTLIFNHVTLLLTHKRFKLKRPNIYIAGHSLGGSIALRTNVLLINQNIKPTKIIAFAPFVRKTYYLPDNVLIYYVQKDPVTDTMLPKNHNKNGSRVTMLDRHIKDVETHSMSCIYNNIIEHIIKENTTGGRGDVSIASLGTAAILILVTAITAIAGAR